MDYTLDVSERPLDDLELTIASWWFAVLLPPVGIVVSAHLVARDRSRLAFWAPLVWSIMPAAVAVFLVSYPL